MFARMATERGACSYCGSVDQPLLRPSVFRDAFELLMGAYRRDDQGEPLLELYRRDWMLFVHSGLTGDNAPNLLSVIYSDEGVADLRYSPTRLNETGTLDQWEMFRKELMFQNRYFPASILNTERLSELIKYLMQDEDDFSDSWFRARIQKSDGCYESDQMGAPPARLASHGRANPAGIPYLYLASSEDTAVSELRPHTGEVASVAVFRIPANLKIVDLRHPRTTVSPFELADENAISLLRSDIALLERLGHELTRPVLPDSAATDYVPSQYLCEFIKQQEWDGVIYSSSVSEGKNLALFNPGCVEIGPITQHRVTKVAVEIEKC